MMRKQDNQGVIRCYDCSHACLERYRTDEPIISLCKKDGGRRVAVTPFRCPDYSANLKPRVINQ